MTVSEFLRWEDGTDTRCELLGGPPVARSLPPVALGVLTARLCGAIGSWLQSRRTCAAQIGGAIAISGRADTCYLADLVVSRNLARRGQQVVEDPLLIVEVLSPGMAIYDRQTKIADYRRIASVEEILLIDSTCIFAEVLRREGDRWITEIVRRPQATLSLASIGLTAAMSELYEGTCPTRPQRHGRLVDRMKRRALFAVLAGAAVWPLAGYAQQPERLRRVGALIAFAENDPLIQESVTAFAQTLARFGWVEGKNIRIDWRFAAGNPALFETYANELVGRSPDAILASGSATVVALRQQTRGIPIVFVGVGDPVGQGFVQSLARPAGNMTGFTAPDAPLYGKWVQLLREIAPRVTRIVVVFNPDALPIAPSFNRVIEDAAPFFGMTVALAPVHDDGEIEEAIAIQAREPGRGLISLPDPFTTAHRDAIIAAAARHGLPIIGATKLFPRAGGLMSYWYDNVGVYGEAASYIDRILKGARPADLPVQQPTKYSLIINLKTAKALGLTVPPSMLDLADEVIE